MRIECGNCKKHLLVSPEDLGKPVSCPHCGGYLISPKDRFSPGVVINDFVIIKQLGKGGMGNVFMAHQLSLERYAALKVLHEKHSRNQTYISELKREAKIAAKLNHPNIVQCYAVGEYEGIYYYAMEYVDGKSLKDILRKKWKLCPEETIRILRPVVVALEYAWREARLVHRDIKPDNIMFTVEGESKLADLGLARPAQEIGDEEGSEFIRGTPHYICPESVLNQPIDFRGDIYSLGCVIYHCVTGHFPFGGASPVEIVKEHVKSVIRDPREYSPDLPPGLCKVINRMLKKNPFDRYQDYSLLLKDLDAVETEAFTSRTGAKSSVSASEQKSSAFRTRVKTPSKTNFHRKDGIKSFHPSPSVTVVPKHDFPSNSKRSRSSIIMVLAFVCVAVLALSLFFFLGNDGGQTENIAEPVIGEDADAVTESITPPPPEISPGESGSHLMIRDVISADEAKKFVGLHKKIVGRAIKISSREDLNGQPTFIDLDRPFPKTPLNAVIWKDNRNDFPDSLEDAFLNRKILISGEIETYKGKPRIILKSPAQIKILPEN